VFVCGDEVNSIYLYAEGQLQAKNSSSHKGGICDLVFGKEHQLFSGGFDGVVCSYDIRKLKEHVTRHDWGGTIWRVVPHQDGRILLCNSSENKFQIVDDSLGKELWNSGTVHGSLAYAADWKEQDLVTASFYDRKLCYWAGSIPS
jgi:WD40 repeat protein